MNAPFRAPSVALAGDRLADAVADFLHALDRGDYGATALQHDGHESAHVADLRTKLAEHRTDRALAAGRGR